MLDIANNNRGCRSLITVTLSLSLSVGGVMQEVLDQALALATEGDALIENSHYAVDSIFPKCSELRAVCENVGAVLKAKKAHLLKAMELHSSLEKARLSILKEYLLMQISLIMEV